MQVTILARESGLKLELESVPILSLVPEPLRVTPTSSVLQGVVIARVL
jgi:hypothetical protein